MQPEVAVRRPPSLKGFFAYETDTDYFRQIVLYGGAPQVDFLTLWMGANFTETQEELHVSPMARAVLSHVFNSPLKALWQPAVQKHMSEIMDSFKKHTPARKYRQLFADWTFAGKTRATNSIPEGPHAQLDKITVPFVVVQDMGEFNLHQFGAYDLMENAGTPANRKWLILAPPEFALPVHRWQLEALASGGADAQTHRLSASVPESGKNAWGAVPFGATVPPGLDEVANPILRFETKVEEDTEFSGPVTLSLRFSCSEIDSHIIARVGRGDADGEYLHLSIGSIRPACRRIDSERSTASEIAIDIDRPEPLVPGEPVTLRFSLTPRPALFRKGEKLVLDIGSRTDILRSDVSQGAGAFEDLWNFPLKFLV